MRPKVCSLCAKMQLVIMVLLNDQDHEKRHGFLKALTFPGTFPRQDKKVRESINFQVRSLLDISTNLET
jgi:hypothetical protein